MSMEIVGRILLKMCDSATAFRSRRALGSKNCEISFKLSITDFVYEIYIHKDFTCISLSSQSLCGLARKFGAFDSWRRHFERFRQTLIHCLFPFHRVSVEQRKIKVFTHLYRLSCISPDVFGISERSPSGQGARAHQAERHRLHQQNYFRVESRRRKTPQCSEGKLRCAIKCESQS